MVKNGSAKLHRGREEVTEGRKRGEEGEGKMGRRERSCGH